MLLVSFWVLFFAVTVQSLAANHLGFVEADDFERQQQAQLQVTYLFDSKVMNICCFRVLNSFCSAES